MARRKLSLEDQLKGVRAAIQSRRTPLQLREGLKRRAKELERELKTKKDNGVLHEFLGL